MDVPVGGAAGELDDTKKYTERERGWQVGEQLPVTGGPKIPTLRESRAEL